MRSLISATSVLALALCFQTAATSMAAADDAGGGDIGINITDEYGQRTWYGSESPEVTALADQAEVFAQSHSDTVLGVALTSDRQMVELFVISSDIDGLDELVSLDPHRIRVVVNENSPEQVDAAQEQVLGLDWDALNIESVAPILSVMESRLSCQTTATSLPLMYATEPASGTWNKNSLAPSAIWGCRYVSR
ncbi:hypothetical protein [Actinomyces procaprae]|uniref:hypothetical protein n=1 Tax=Actinomyces procaprae TaxID=2560010 RepID=UPI00109DB5C3|nr:hypothetical protein [Actinomyces procaprae]